MVENSGLEPLTSYVQGRRSPSWANSPFGWKCDFLQVVLKKVTKCAKAHEVSFLSANCEKMVGLPRFELGTSPLSGVHSNQLSYRPINNNLYKLNKKK